MDAVDGPKSQKIYAGKTIFYFQPGKSTIRYHWSLSLSTSMNYRLQNTCENSQ
tara:strand:+ start:509 stop:667 length:159 start_codon:yes stop_codon:yes gene_type:complete